MWIFRFRPIPDEICWENNVLNKYSTGFLINFEILQVLRIFKLLMMNFNLKKNAVHSISFHIAKKVTFHAATWIAL